MEIKVMGREVVRQVLSMEQVIEGVADVYKLKAEGKTAVWPLVAHEFEEKHAAMDIRSGYVGGLELHGLKMLNNFPLNTQQNLPSFNGMLVIFDSNTGIPLGVMDAAYITCMRTGAASAIGAKALARPNSKTLLVLGAGKQSAYQVAAMLIAFPGIEKVIISDPLALENARTVAAGMPALLAAEFGLARAQQVAFAAAESLADSVAESDIIITITPSRKPVIMAEWVRPGTHFSCIGSDMAGKEEIDPALFRGARIYADDKPQCMRVGEMELPLAAGVITEADICGELGELLAGTKPGRANDEEITIFDATGLALLDLVTGKFAIDEAAKRGLGATVDI
ncbi:ornithine cyclodeaminase family protein [Ruminococcaceae bacterium OttesenSCG-928-A11]|nr:ornithine cyclodeaminase family protein [Ruminococcaceae bacterium OttesenSCG-928-A11]